MNTVAAGATKVVSITLSAPSVPGPYTDTASTTSSTDDPNLANNTSSVTVTVLARIAAAGTEVAATEGVSFSGQVASFTFTDPNSVASAFTATINWGDQLSSAGTISG